MSGLILPARMRGHTAEEIAGVLGIKKPETAVLSEPDPEVSGTQLPTPVGYHMLLIIPETAKTFEGDLGIVKAEITRTIEEVATVVGFVAAMGPDCYADIQKFPTGPWCKVGDFVLVRAYAGTRFKVHGREMRMLNDDAIEAVVDDPRGLTRV